MISRKDLADSRAEARKILRSVLPTVGSQELRSRIESYLKRPNKTKKPSGSRLSPLFR